MTRIFNFWIWFIFLVPHISFGQETITDTTLHTSYNNKVTIKNFAIPIAFVTYGFISLENKELKKLNINTKNKLQKEYPFFKSSLDNYIQFAPAIVVFGLNAVGIKGAHNLKDATILYVGTIGINSAIIFPLKKITHIMRPDSSGYTSFPSGHTAIAFASAEFLRREYGQKYPWLAAAGYVVAAGTGAYRMLNNKHWFSDVVAGAGVGIASANLSYWLFDKFKTKTTSATAGIFLYPVVQPGCYGIGLVKAF